MKNAMACIGLAALVSASAMAEVSVSNYEDLSEGFLGNGDFYYNGVTYTGQNSVDGVFPDGNTFDAGGDGVNSLGNDIIVENANFFFDEFSGFGSRRNVLTFGRSFVPGDNLSLGAMSTVTMQLDQSADFASIDVGYLENGPWGGIVFHFEASLGGVVVDADTFTVSDLGGRDNGAFEMMSVGGVEFDSLQLFATYQGQFTAPRVIIDDLTVNTIPAPGSMALLLGAGAALTRRRR
jgi:hypothetical protein